MDLSVGNPMIDRRDFLARALTAVGAVVVATGVPAAARAATLQHQFAVTGPFTRSTVAEIARALAKKPYEAPDTSLPPILENLTYDQYRDIRFRPETAIWADKGLLYQMQLFHRGSYFKDPVEMALVENGQATHVPYDPNLFNYGPLVPQPIPAEDIGFSGFRLHSPLNKPDVFDEVLVFQGASYFRSLGKDEVYGLSARGLALKTADPEGEEFPLFRAFWVETPTAGSDTCVVNALLDSPSVAGAYRFTIRPGLPTTIDVEAQLFPRADLEKVGLAPGTSMFFFSANGRTDIDDFRPEVHDSDGMLMVTGRGDRWWRPLANPKELQISAFQDRSPRGFGLIQRNRGFGSYQDLEAAYQKRPSLWIEPVGDWGAGAVTLVEIPTNSEIHDNIVAYWAPQDKIPAGTEFFFAYRLFWGGDPALGAGAAYVTATRSGRAGIGGPTPVRLFVIDYSFFEGVDPAKLGAAKASVQASKGTVKNVVVIANPETGGMRLSFELDPQNETLIELTAALAFEAGQTAETWAFRWTA